MGSSEILGIFRLDKQEHLERVLDGKLRFTPIEKYRVMEDREPHRNDSMEGLKRVSQDAGRKDWIPVRGAGLEIRIVSKVKISGALPNVSVLCFSAFTGSDITDWRVFSIYRMDPRMLAFGNVALVIWDTERFIDRFQNKAREMGLQPDNGLVEYVDGDRHEGVIKRIGFTKLKDPFQYQKEYRLALRFNDIAPHEYILDIGSIKDIAEICQVNKPGQELV